MEQSFFNSNDLVWTKNVKREGGNAWAYMEFHVGDVFYLNWPRGRANMGKTDAGKAKVNELILLFQTVNKNSGSKKGTYLTHIVTPIEQRVTTDEDSSHPFKRLVTVIGKANDPIPKPQIFDFREPNRGWACNLDLIKPFKRLNLSFTLFAKRKIFWDLFTEKDVNIKQINNLSEILVDAEQPEHVLEGAEKYLMGRHKYYERDLSIILRKKQIAQSAGSLICEVCKFNFSIRYGDHGIGFIECHHIMPIAGNGIRKTKVEDLALVCSNCHRMLHRKNIKRTFFTIDELREIYQF